MCSLHSGMQADSPAPAETFASKPEQSTAVPHKLMNDPKPIQALTWLVRHRQVPGKHVCTSQALILPFPHFQFWGLHAGIVLFLCLLIPQTLIHSWFTWFKLLSISLNWKAAGGDRDGGHICSGFESEQCQTDDVCKLPEQEQVAYIKKSQLNGQLCKQSVTKSFVFGQKQGNEKKNCCHKVCCHWS